MRSVLLLLLLASSAWAQSDYPNKPVRLVVGFAAGGISDVFGRAIAIPLSKQLGQQVLVENKPGAGTTIAGDYIARSAPDGYTLWLQDITTHAINANLYAKLPYDTIKDFSYVAMVASTPLMLVVHPSTPANNVRELIALLKANPGKYSYGSSGNGTIVHLASEMLKSSAGVDALHVPYKGSNPATAAILGGEVTFVFSTMPPAVSNMSSGKLRALAVTTPKRSAAAPDVPTMIEAGLPGFEIVLYSGVLAPKGLERAIVQRLNAEINDALNDEKIKGRMRDLGVEPMPGRVEAFDGYIRSETTKWAKVIRQANIKLD